MSLHAVPDPGAWSAPAGGHPCFLVEARTPVEWRLVRSWIGRQSTGGDPLVVALPTPGRRGNRRAALDRLREIIESTADLVLVPVRIVWTAAPTRGRRVPRLLDLITFGDPRDPNRLLQEILVRFRPDRARVVAGDTATVEALRDRWARERAGRPDALSGFTDFVALQAAITLEVAERRVRGNRYKVPRFVAEDLLGSAAFEAGIADLAARVDEDEIEVRSRASGYLKEIAATPSTFVIDLVAALVRAIYTLGYDRRIRYDRASLERVAALGQTCLAIY